MTKSIKRSRAVQWTCPVCSLEMEVRKGQHAKVTRHIRRTHQTFYEENLKNRNCGYRGTNAQSGIGLRELLSPLQFLPVGPKAYFKCPFCSKGLEDKPRSRHLLVLSKKAQLIRDCKKVKKTRRGCQFCNIPDWRGKAWIAQKSCCVDWEKQSGCKQSTVQGHCVWSRRCLF